MKNLGTALGTAFGLALLVALMAGGYLLLQWVLGAFAVLEPQMRTLAAIGSVTALVAAVIVAEGLKGRGQADVPETAQRTALYERLLSSCCGSANPRGEPGIPDDGLVAIERSLALHGSSNVISAYLQLKRLAKPAESAGETRVALLRALVKAMRTDLGASQSVRKPDDLVELLNDRASP